MDKLKLTTTTYDKICKVFADACNGPSDKIDLFLRGIKEGGQILDAGCGPGIDAGYMASKGFSVTGVDVSGKMIELASKKNPKVNFEKADIRKLKYNPGTFDGIFVSFSIIHLPKKDVPKTIKSFYEMLKNGGVIYFGVQEGDSREIISETPFKPGQKMFLNIISSGELRETLAGAGLEILNEFIRPPKHKMELNFNKLIVIARKV